MADAPGVLKGGQIGGVRGYFGFSEAFGGGDARALLVEVGGGADDENAVEVDAAGIREEAKGLQDTVIFHGGEGVGGEAFGLVVDPGAGSLAEEFAMPESGGGELVAAQDGRGLVGGAGWSELLATLGHLRGVEEPGGAGEFVGQGDKIGIEPEDDPVVAVEAVCERRLVGL